MAKQSIMELLMETLREAPGIDAESLMSHVCYKLKCRHARCEDELTLLADYGLATFVEGEEEDAWYISDDLVRDKPAMDEWTQQHKANWPAECQHPTHPKNQGCSWCAVQAGLSFVSAEFKPHR
jgi:hypothetical protein